MAWLYPSIRIPAGEADHVETKTTTVPADMEVTTLFPHLHVRGKSFKYDCRVSRWPQRGPAVGAALGLQLAAALPPQDPSANRPPSAPRSSTAGRPGPGSRARVHAPHPGDMLAGRGVVDPAVARQLVGLLPVLPATLAVALAGDAAVSAADPAGQTEARAPGSRPR